MRPPRIGVREAKARLSRLLEDVREGREWIITDRGKPVARLGPVSTRTMPLPERLSRLEASGVLEPLARGRPLPPLIQIPEGLAQAWLQEDRGD